MGSEKTFPLMPPTNRKLLCIIIITLPIAILFGLLLASMDTIMRMRIDYEATIRNGSAIFSSWLSPSIPVYLKVYMYNLTDVSKRSVLPIEEVGPFVYRQLREKVNIVWSNETPAKEVSYGQKITYVFEPEMSVAPDDEVYVNSINLATVALDAISKKKFTFLLSNMINSKDFWINKSVHALLWGYEDPFLSMLHKLSLSKQKHIGLLYGKNGSIVANYTVLTGVDNTEDIGRIISYNGESQLTYWRSKEANMLNGTDGSLAPTNLDMNSKLYFFSPDMCRSFLSSYVTSKAADNRPDVELYGFSVPSYETANISINPANAAFCKEENNRLDCAPDGLIDLSECRKIDGYSLPIYASASHMLGVGKEITERLEGQPRADPLKDQTLVWIEPMTGFILEAYKKLQINIKIDFEPYLLNKNPLYFPVMWVQEYAVADPPTLNRLHHNLVTLPYLIKIFVLVLLIIALTNFVVSSIVMVVTRRKTSSRGEHKLAKVVSNNKTKKSIKPKPDGEKFLESKSLEKTIEA